jgi:hypothetical protein
MNTDLAVQMTSLTLAKVQGSVEIAVLKQQQQMDQSLIAMIDDAVRAAPPPGQGLRVDKLA